MKVKLEFETTEETITLLNGIMYQIARNEGNGLSEKQKELIENFRLKIILPVVIDSEKPIAEALARYFGSKTEIIP